MAKELKKASWTNEASGESQNSPSTLAHTAYRRLRHDIVTGVFSPGQPLRLELLKERYNLSFSPLREALNRLQAERLVVAAALRGFSVAPVSIEEMWDATETRILIECEALRRSIVNGDDNWEAGIVAAFHALDLQVRRMPANNKPLSSEELSALEVRHQEFHRALIGKCHSRRLIELADQLHAETYRYRIPTLAGKVSTTRDVPREHRRIMEATLARDATKALSLLSAHYRKTAQVNEEIALDRKVVLA